jgi:lysophospholipase L1-like esterase
MSKTLKLFFCFMLAAGLASSQESIGGNFSVGGNLSISAHSSQPVIMACLGDSITAGYTVGGNVSGYLCPTIVSDLNTLIGGSLITNVSFPSGQNLTAGVIGSTTAQWETGGAGLPGGGGDVSSLCNGTGGGARFSPGLVTAGATLVSFMLGTNDAVAAVSSGNYSTRVQNIITALKSCGVQKIILHYQPYNNATPAADPYLLQYQTVIGSLAAADPTHVLVGDTTAYTYYQSNPSCEGDGLHPIATGCGYPYLASIQAAAIKGALGY